MIPTARRFFSSSRFQMAGSLEAIKSRALVFHEHGSPSESVVAETHEVPPVPKGHVRVKFLYAPINPADLGVIKGFYPLQPPVRKTSAGITYRVIGNEGVAVVEGVHPEDENRYKLGQRVLMGSVQLGTWQQYENISADSLIPVENDDFSDERAATLMLNPSTAYRMISDYAPVRDTPNSWLIQNAANSTVGRNIIQMSKHWGIRTINLVRDRPEDDFKKLSKELTDIGADIVMSYGDLLNKDTAKRIDSAKGEGKLLLAINCVGGDETTNMTKLLDRHGTLVTYGAMSNGPLKILPYLFTFQDLRAVGHWQSKWVETHSFDDNKKLADELVNFASNGVIDTPPTKVLDLSSAEDDADATRKIRGYFNADTEPGAPKTLLKMI